MKEYDVEEELQLILVEPDSEKAQKKLKEVEEKINSMSLKCDLIIQKLRNRRAR